MSLSRPIIALLAAFQPVFTRLTWQKAMVLLVGALLTRSWRTVTVALPQMRLEDSPQFSEYHQVLNHAQWSPLQLSWCLLNLFVTLPCMQWPLGPTLFCPVPEMLVLDISTSNQYPLLRAMANRDSLGKDSDLSFCRLSCLTESSPTVSNSR